VGWWRCKPSSALVENEPVKCPDCGTWWRGDEHRCPAFYLTSDGTRVVAGGGGGRSSSGIALAYKVTSMVVTDAMNRHYSVRPGDTLTVTDGGNVTITYPKPDGWPDDEPPQRAGALV
jgi:hypothetical protein